MGTRESWQESFIAFAMPFHTNPVQDSTYTDADETNSQTSQTQRVTGINAAFDVRLETASTETAEGGVPFFRKRLRTLGITLRQEPSQVSRSRLLRAAKSCEMKRRGGRELEDSDTRRYSTSVFASDCEKKSNCIDRLSSSARRKEGIATEFSIREQSRRIARSRNPLERPHERRFRRRDFRVNSSRHIVDRISLSRARIKPEVAEKEKSRFTLNRFQRL